MPYLEYDLDSRTTKHGQALCTHSSCNNVVAGSWWLVVAGMFVAFWVMDGFVKAVV